MGKNLVIQSDFGTADGAVSAMYGVAISVDPGVGTDWLNVMYYLPTISE